jgi:hypothetical protein
MLTASSSLLAVGKAMSKLAANPRDPSAKVTLRRAAASLRRAARQAPRRQRVGLTNASAAVRALADHGLGKAARVETALLRAGHITEHACAFPVS